MSMRNLTSTVMTIICVSTLTLTLFLPFSAMATQTPTQPLQPATGPGSAQYRFSDVEQLSVGEQETGASIFMPAGASPTDLADVPVVLFIHGFLALDITIYQDWIHHLVRRGAVVIYPTFQTLNVIDVLPASYAYNMFSGIKSAIEYLEGSSIPDIGTQSFHVVGHSLGGVLAVRYAQDADRLGFPNVASLTVIEPGGCANCGTFPSVAVPLTLDRRIPANVTAQVIVGDADDTVGDADARAIWPLMADIAPDRKDYVTVRSDDHGEPPMDADHEMVGSTGAAGELDAMDWYALWRPLDALISCVDSETDCITALGNTPEHNNMGNWSDGTPIIPLLITDGPPT